MCLCVFTSSFPCPCALHCSWATGAQLPPHWNKLSALYPHAPSITDTHTSTQAHTHTYTYIYMYLYRTGEGSGYQSKTSLLVDGLWPRVPHVIDLVMFCWETEPKDKAHREERTEKQRVWGRGEGERKGENVTRPRRRWSRWSERDRERHRGRESEWEKKEKDRGSSVPHCWEEGEDPRTYPVDFSHPFWFTYQVTPSICVWSNPTEKKHHVFCLAIQCSLVTKGQLVPMIQL